MREYIICADCVYCMTSFCTGNGVSWRTSVLQYRCSVRYTAIIIRYKKFTCDLYKNMDGKDTTSDHAGQSEVTAYTLNSELNLFSLSYRSVSLKR